MRRCLSHGLAIFLALLTTALVAPDALAAQSVLADKLAAEAPKANPKVLALAARAAECARKQGAAAMARIGAQGCLVNRSKSGIPDGMIEAGDQVWRGVDQGSVEVENHRPVCHASPANLVCW